MVSLDKRRKGILNLSRANWTLLRGKKGVGDVESHCLSEIPSGSIYEIQARCCTLETSSFFFEERFDPSIRDSGGIVLQGGKPSESCFVVYHSWTAVPVAFYNQSFY